MAKIKEFPRCLIARAKSGSTYLVDGPDELTDLLIGDCLEDSFLSGNVNRNLTICDNLILTTLTQSLMLEMTRFNHLTSLLLKRHE
jgi:hypothetical protein